MLATTSLRARAELEPPDFAQITDRVDVVVVVVRVSVADRGGTGVVHAEITDLVTRAG